MKSENENLAAPDEFSGPESPLPMTSAGEDLLFVPQAAPLNKVRLTLLVSMMFSLLVSAIFRTPPIVFMAAILCAAPPAAIILGRLSSRRLRIERTLPAVGVAGEILHGTLTVENHSRWPAFITRVRAGQISKAFYGKAKGDDWSVRAEADGVQEIPLLGAFERLEVPQTWYLRRRGVYQLPPARAGSIDPLGFANELGAQSEAQELVILPRTVRLARLGFVGGNAARMQAPQHSSMVADAMDFHGVRPWQPGEAIRRIHWKSTARTGQLQIVEWEENVARDLALLLDTQAATLAGENGENTLETTITIAATVAQHLLEGGYACQIFYWQPHEDGCEMVHINAQSSGDLSKMLRLLAGVIPTDHADATLLELAHRAPQHLPAGRASLIVSSTMADIAAARRLLSARAALGGQCYTLALDATTFAQKTHSKKAEVRGPGLSGIDPLSRVFRSGDSIAAALEQMT